uniref:NaTx n=1 Tax=Centruroides hentzi TaxID=88313 RepID=A0A2I9LPB2_9SCOR
MKFFLIVSLAIASCFMEMKEVYAGTDGIYPVDFQGIFYECIIYNRCERDCKIHGASYGYCYAGVCYCEGLPEENKFFWDVMKKQCTYM